MGTPFRSGLLALAVLLMAPPTGTAESLSVALLEYPPFECNPEKENGRWGYMPEVILEIFGKQGFDVRFEILPWKRAIVDTEKGVYDAIPLVNSGHSRVLIFSREKSAVLKQMFYVKKGSSWRNTGPASWESITIGWVLGYDYSTFSKEYQKYIEDHLQDRNRIVYTAGDTASADMFKKLLTGRVTTFNEDQTFFQYTMGKGGIGRPADFEVAGTLGTNDQYMGFSPANPQAARYAAIFDQGIRALRESGRLKAILDSYGIEDWEQTQGE